MKKKFYGEEETEVGKKKANMKRFDLVCYALGICYWAFFMYSL